MERMSRAGLVVPDSGSSGRMLRLPEGSIMFSPIECELSLRLFLVVDSDEDGEVHASQAVTFLRRSGLPEDVLREVWRWAFGGTSRPKMSLAEWFVAIKLVALAQRDGQVTSRDALFRNTTLPLANFELLPVPPDYAVDTSPTRPSNCCSVAVTHPVIKGSGLSRFVEYTVETSTTLPHFYQHPMSVKRRYSDFVWLHQRLCQSYPATAVPPIPGKRVLRNFQHEFIEDRRLCLGEFLKYVIRHPKLSHAFDLQVMLDASATGFMEYKALTFDRAEEQLLGNGRGAARADASTSGDLHAPTGTGVSTLVSLSQPSSMAQAANASARAFSATTQWLFAEPSLGGRLQEDDGADGDTDFDDDDDDSDDDHGNDAGNGNNAGNSGRSRQTNHATGGTTETLGAVATGNGMTRSQGIQQLTGVMMESIKTQQRLALYQTALSELARSLSSLLAHRKSGAEREASLGCELVAWAHFEASHSQRLRQCCIGQHDTFADGFGVSSNDHEFAQHAGTALVPLATRTQQAAERDMSQVLGPLRYMFGQVKAMRSVLETLMAKRREVVAAQRRVDHRKRQYDTIRTGAGMNDMLQVEHAKQRMHAAQRRVATVKCELQDVAANVNKQVDKYERERLGELQRVAVLFVKEQAELAHDRTAALKRLRVTLLADLGDSVSSGENEQGDNEQRPMAASTLSPELESALQETANGPPSAGLRAFHSRRTAAQHKMTNKFKETLDGQPIMPRAPAAAPAAAAATGGSGGGGGDGSR